MDPPCAETRRGHSSQAQPCIAPALAASAGGIAALRAVLGGLPPDFPAAILVVVHLEPGRRSMLANILGGATTLLVKDAEEGDCIERGIVYVRRLDPNKRDRTV